MEPMCQHRVATSAIASHSRTHFLRQRRGLVSALVEKIFLVHFIFFGFYGTSKAKQV